MLLRGYAILTAARDKCEALPLDVPATLSTCSVHLFEQWWEHLDWRAKHHSDHTFRLKQSLRYF
jgi:hypothetical protein